MTALVLEPHADDAALFAAYSACAEAERDGCRVVTVLRDTPERDDEAAWAARHLGCESSVLPFHEATPDWRAIRQALVLLRDEHDAVYAPAVVARGHEHHNRVGKLAGELFGDRVRFYTTYTRTGGRQASGSLVDPKPIWIARKLRALACYETQIARPDTRSWFTSGLDEWLA